MNFIFSGVKAEMFVGCDPAEVDELAKDLQLLGQLVIEHADSVEEQLHRTSWERVTPMRCGIACVGSRTVTHKRYTVVSPRWLTCCDARVLSS